MQDNARNRGVALPNTPRLPLAQVPRAGVNVYNLHLEVTHDDRGNLVNGNKVEQTFQMIAEARFHWVRLQFPWEDIEVCGKGNFLDCRHGNISTWDKYDYIVQQAASYGLELIVRLDRPPAWARARYLQTPEVVAQVDNGNPVTGPPDRLEDFGDYVAAVALRYPQVRYFQIWNEPNLQSEWNYHRQNPAELVQLLQLARSRIHESSPGALILFPSLAPTDGLDKTGVNDLEYLQHFYEAGGRATFDILGAQLYGLGQPPDVHRYVRLGKALSRPLDTRADVSRVVLLREIMVRNGDAAKAVWVTELGWNSAPPVLPQLWGKAVSEDQKGQYIVGAWNRAEIEWPWMGVMAVWMFRMGGVEPDPRDPTQFFQLVTFDFKPLASFAAIERYLDGPTQPTVYHTPRRWLWLVLYPALIGLAALGIVTLASAALPTTAVVMLSGARQLWSSPEDGLRAFIRGLRADTGILTVIGCSLLWFYRASPQLPLTLVGLAGMTAAIVWRPDLGLLFVPVTAPLYLAPKGIWDERFGIRPTGLFFQLHEVILGLVVVGALLPLLLHRRLLSNMMDRVRRGVRLKNSGLILIGLFLLAGIIGIMVAPTPGRSDALRAWRWWVFEPVVVYLLIRRYLVVEGWRRKMVTAWLLTSVGLAAIGLLQVVGINIAPFLADQRCFSSAIVAAEGVRRASSVYCHPNNLALTLGRSWPVLLALALGGSWRSLRHDLQRTRTWHLAWLVGSGVILLGLGATFSKGGFIGALCAFVVLGWLMRRPALIGMVLVGFILLGSVGLVNGVQRLNPLGGSSGARVELWNSALLMLHDHPITGVGLDQFLRLRDPQSGSRYISTDAANTNERFASHPHNLVLGTLLETGWLGLFALTGIVVRTLWRAWRVTRDHINERALFAGLFAALVAALVHGMVDNFYFVSDLAVSFWLLVALVDGPFIRIGPAGADARQFEGQLSTSVWRHYDDKTDRSNNRVR
ncbi:MAG: O-antigen ligase family protein [Herpetosiphon sp.]